MKLTAILLTIFCLHVSARSYEQTVSFKGKDVPLQTLFNSIEKQTGLSFFFNYELLKGAKPITLDVRNISLEDLLSKVLKDQGLDYYKQGKTVFIVKAASTSILISQNSSPSQVDVKGKVTDQRGSPLPGASVYLKKGNKGAITDEKGTFELRNVPSDAALEISYAGYQKAEVALNGRSTITVELSPSSSQLDQTEVIAYGQTSQRYNVGAVTTIKAEDIEKQPINNPLLALEGRVPGMLISQQNGMANGGVKIQIRGQNDIAGATVTNDPFYVVDGVPYPSQLLLGLNTTLGSSGAPNGLVVGSPLSFINPSDIESISVLKDADATAIYGSRAANGAIIITTKKGKAGRTTVNINAQAGIGKVTERLNLMNIAQFLQMRHEAKANDGLGILPSDYDINGTWDSIRNVDWQKVLLGGAAQYDNLNGTVSGGSNNTQYLIGGTFHRETTVFGKGLADVKGAMHFNLNSSSDNHKFKVQLTGDYMIDVNQLPKSDLTSLAVSLAPDAPPLYTSTGDINWAYNASGAPSWSNPVANLVSKYTNKTTNLISNVILSYQLLPNLLFSSSLGYANMQTNESALVPQTANAPIYTYTSLRSARFGFNNINSWIIEPQFTYKIRIGKGLAEALAGATINQSNSSGLQISGSGQTSDQVLGNLTAATSLSIISTTSAIYKYNAAFGRLNYNWADQFLLNFSARRDGSSRFGPQNQFHNFWSVGAGWIFSNVNFIQKSLGFLSFGKIRASYGTTGSDQIGDYQFLNLYSTKSYAAPYEGAASITPSSLTNPYLAWQQTNKLEVGVDIGLLKDRIILNADYFENRSSNQLLNYPLSIITGFNSILENVDATVQNAGWEGVLNTCNIKTKKFEWLTSINISTSANKLVAFPSQISSPYFKIGQPINYTLAYHFEGVNATTGLYQFSDGKGGSTSNPEANPLLTQTKIIKTTPAYFGGITNSFRYRTVTLDFLIQFVKQRGANYYYGSYPYGVIGGNEPNWLVNRWKQPGDNSTHQKATTGYSYFGVFNDLISSDAAFSDASFIRLKNLSISWGLPTKWCKRSCLQSARIYLQGQNILLFTHYKGLDPETLSSRTLPPLRVITGGIQITL